MRRDEIVVAATMAEDVMPVIPEMPEIDDADIAGKLETPITDLDLSVRSSKCMR